MFSQNKNSLFLLIILLLVWSPVQAWILHTTFSLPWDNAFIDGGITSFFLGLSGLLISNTLRFYYSAKKQIIFLLAGVLLVAYASVTLSELVVNEATNGPFQYLVDFHVQRSMYAGLILLIQFSISWQRTSKETSMEDDERRATTEKMARDAELASLRQQLQPHFLFNSLNSINALIGIEPEKARRMVQQLSDFLRGTIKKDDSQLVPLFEELRQLRLYLEIEKVRFGYRLSTHIDSDNASLDSKLPPLLMQPVVENAIKFGLYDTLGDTVISIKTRVENNCLLIEVENPFDATTAAPSQGTGFGLSSLQRRLYLLYARNDLLITTQNENTFTTQILIPQPS